MGNKCVSCYSDESTTAKELETYEKPLPENMINN